MYKVFSGEKMIVLTGSADNADITGARKISYTGPDPLKVEVRALLEGSNPKTLIVTGQEEEAFNRLKSLFSYIEAAGGLVYNQKNELLMIFRNNRWDLPKGKLEAGEEPEQGAVREVEEECGIGQLKVERLISMSHHIYRQDQREFLKRTYWYIMRTSDGSAPVPQREEGIDKVEWMSREKVLFVWPGLFDSLKEVLRAASF